MAACGKVATISGGDFVLFLRKVEGIITREESGVQIFSAVAVDYSRTEIRRQLEMKLTIII